jgi:hypothetical protein
MHQLGKHKAQGLGRNLVLSGFCHESGGQTLQVTG